MVISVVATRVASAPEGGAPFAGGSVGASVASGASVAAGASIGGASVSAGASVTTSGVAAGAHALRTMTTNPKITSDLMYISSLPKNHRTYLSANKKRPDSRGVRAVMLQCKLDVWQAAFAPQRISLAYEGQSKGCLPFQLYITLIF
jgi:hypothetical protein